MNRLVARLTLAAILLVSISPAMGADQYWNYTNRAANPTQHYYPQPAPVKQERPLLQRLLIGGALVGIGFAAGRLTAPKPDPYYSGNTGYTGYAPQPYRLHAVGYRERRRF